MPRVIVLGAGRVGSAIARDLAVEPGVELTALDASEAALRRLRESPQGGVMTPPTQSITSPSSEAFH
jgi:saccharopine dehydrogenase-like NADP-dependent oxidoreductase